MDKIPVIIDTDIGDDIDDIWALVLALRMDNLDILGISVCMGDTFYKAKLVTKILNTLGISKIPIYIGKPTSSLKNFQDDWLRDWELDNYNGKIFDTPNSFIDIINNRTNNTTLLCLGPMRNINELLEEDEFIAEKISIIAMGGSIRRGYINLDGPCQEYNVMIDIQSFRYVLEKVNNFLLVPLDVCRSIIIEGSYYKELLNNREKRAVEIILDNYFLWNDSYEGGAIKFDIDISSSIIYDFGPLFYLIRPNLFTDQEVKVMVDNQGNTIEGEGKKIKCLLEIRNKEYFYKETIRLLTTGDDYENCSRKS